VADRNADLVRAALALRADVPAHDG